MEQKTVFISYRRALSKHLARSIFQNLRSNSWDVFLDVDSIDSGDFDRIILNQIQARAHFILLISKGSLERCKSSDDWVLREIQEAVRLKRNIVPIIEDGVNFENEMSYLPLDLRTIISKKNALPLNHFYFDAALDKLRNRYLKAPEYIEISLPSPAEQAEIQRRISEIESTISYHSDKLLPDPFAWIDIPNKDYRIAKYPVTNSQFAIFKADDGYQNKEWWLPLGWREKVEKNWKTPRYWHDPKWNEYTSPVVGVSWHEAFAYTRWLSNKAGERIELPSEDQWQYAAQGDGSYPYPWGMQWNSDRCNSSVRMSSWGQTTSVTKYEDMGDSPFGVVDMLGNVWEWCKNWDENKKPLRGGYWRSDSLQIEKRIERRPVLSLNQWGFRLVKHQNK